MQRSSRICFDLAEMFSEIAHRRFDASRCFLPAICVLSGCADSKPEVVVQKFTVGGITDIFVGYSGLHLAVEGGVFIQHSPGFIVFQLEQVLITVVYLA